MNQELRDKLIESGHKGEFELSELIEACGDKFKCLRIKEWCLDDKKWEACGGKKLDYEANYEITECGSTLEEAVANLWLKINDYYPTEDKETKGT
jgi:hypothetical protein